MAKQNPNLWKEIYDKDEFKTHMSGEEHVETQSDEREFGPIGSLSRYELRRWIEQFGGENSEGEDTDDEDYRVV